MLLGPRGIRFFWVLGFVLLLGTAVGAGWFFNQPATGSGLAGGDAFYNGVEAFGQGLVDVPDGLTFMHPLQVGRVKIVQVQEGDAVKAGDLLLSVDNDVQRLRLQEALADLDAARKELADAQRQLPLDIAIQKKKIEALQADYDIAQRELDKVKNTGSELAKGQLPSAEDKLKAAAARIEAEQALLKKIEDTDVVGPVERLKDKVKSKQAQAELAQRAVFECDVYAPGDGIVLRLYATPGDALSNQPRQPAIVFCPNVQRIIRTEVLQEFADKVQVGQIAYIEDDTRAATRWKGQVVRVPQWLANRRAMMFEPFQYNDVRMLECIVALDPGAPPVRIGQRMRVIIMK
jgi:multidrug efflux pump subunit AcrA (membrane-fusion protein)